MIERSSVDRWAKEVKTTSPVPCVISLNFFGDLQNYTFLESLGPAEPEK